MTRYLITTSNCHACEQMKAKLKRHMIEHTVLDYNRSEAQELIAKYALRPVIRGFPVFVKINGSNVVVDCFSGHIRDTEMFLRRVE